ncbi:MAG: decaprenyl-phosphate phosphoribosyltransferase [Candidatus Eisenbacteria bacterium]
MSPLAAFVQSLRPYQWVKNGLVLAGVLFAGRLTDGRAIALALEGVVAFSLLSGAVYLINDLHDLAADRLHPKKRLRPLASGRLSPGMARAGLAVVLLAATILAFHLGPRFAATAAGYLALNLAYSIGLKHVVLVDVLAIALGFVLRAIAGVALLVPLVPDVELSPWLLVCTFFLALFLACGKRRQELLHQDATQAVDRRRVLLAYNAPFLDTLVAVSAATTLVAYAIYTIWPATVAKFHTTGLLWTIPLVTYGIFRYLWLTRVQDEGEDPSHAIIADRPLLVAIALWALLVAIVLYVRV